MWDNVYHLGFQSFIITNIFANLISCASLYQNILSIVALEKIVGKYKIKITAIICDYNRLVVISTVICYFKLVEIGQIRTNRTKRPDFFCRTSNLLLFKDEKKASADDFDLAVNNLLTNSIQLIPFYLVKFISLLHNLCSARHF